VKVKAPGGAVKMQYRKRKPSIAKCSKCKSPLKGIPRLRPVKMQNISKSQKTVARPYGGNMCSSCTRSLIKAQARVVENV
jgi:large subunit ribosomal protein L34e